MGIKKLTPTSPARRYQTYLTRDELTAGAVPEKSLLEPKKRISGRNNDGRITVRRRGGGHKRFYRMVDFKRDKEGVPGRITQIEYDPNRSAHIALVTYLDGEKRYIIAPIGIEVGKTIMSGAEADILPGNYVAANQHSAGHADSQHRIASRQRWPDGTVGGRVCAARCQRRRLRTVANAVRRS